MTVHELTTDLEIEAAYPLMVQLRPHLVRDRFLANLAKGGHADRGGHHEHSAQERRNVEQGAYKSVAGAVEQRHTDRVLELLDLPC